MLVFKRKSTKFNHKNGADSFLSVSLVLLFTWYMEENVYAWLWHTQKAKMKWYHEHCAIQV